MSTDTTAGNPTTGTLHAGWDFFTSEPGRHEVLHCRVCGMTMAVDRGVVGPTGWTHAVAIHAGQAKGRPHDSFHCERAGEAWHGEALALRQEAEATSSKRMADQLTAEADEVVRTREATKAVTGLS